MPRPEKFWSPKRPGRSSSELIPLTILWHSWHSRTVSVSTHELGKELLVFISLRHYLTALVDVANDDNSPVSNDFLLETSVRIIEQTHALHIVSYVPSQNRCINEHDVFRTFHCSNSSIGTSSTSFPTIAFATFHTCIRLSSAALHKTQGSFIFQLKSDI